MKRIALSLVAVLALAGCGGGDNAGAQPKATPSGDASPKATAQDYMAQMRLENPTGYFSMSDAELREEADLVCGNMTIYGVDGWLDMAVQAQANGANINEGFLAAWVPAVMWRCPDKEAEFREWAAEHDN
jgi:hypothetical protein